MAKEYRTYAQKLLDPQWQRRRLEVFQRDNFTRQSIYDNCENKTLHVHHKIYRKGADPWDYEDRELVTLCEDCHKAAERDLQTIREALVDDEIFHLVFMMVLSVQAAPDTKKCFKDLIYELAGFEPVT